MSTALALVNRMRAKRRDATSSVVTDKTGVAYLDFLNAAITTVLEERTWNFQHRSDGVLYTIPHRAVTTVVATLNNTYVNVSHPAITAATAEHLYGAFTLRLLIDSDTSFGDSSMTVNRVSYVAGSSANVLLYLDQQWKGTTTTTGTGSLFSYEYALPSTVRSVTNVLHQEREIALGFVDEDYSFDRMVPRPHDSVSDTPELVMVGGEIHQTYEYAAGSDQGFAKAIKIYPVPDSALMLNYSYIYKNAKLTAAGSELTRVPDVVEDLIVDLATARVISSLEKDVEHGLPLEARVMKNVDRVHRNHGVDSGRRTPMKSFDQIGRIGSPNWPPRSVTGLAGS